VNYTSSEGSRRTQSSFEYISGTLYGLFHQWRMRLIFHFNSSGTVNDFMNRILEISCQVIGMLIYNILVQF